jgi:hypothetical protein
MARCIFCRTETRSEPVEHIVPHGLVGDVSFTIRRNDGSTRRRSLILARNQVCGVCNLANGRLDDYLQRQLGLVKALMPSGPRRTGKPPRAERPGMLAVRQSSGLQLTLNASNKPLRSPDGTIVPPAGHHPMAARLTSFDPNAEPWTMSISHDMRMNKRFVRALHKIAFELLCLKKGARFVLDDRFDTIREYVRFGRGSREALLVSAAPELPIRAQLAVIYLRPVRAWLVRCSVGLQFLIDLTGDNRLVLGFGDTTIDGVPVHRIGRAQ